MINQVTSVIMFFNVVFLLVMGYMMFWPIQLSDILNEPFPVTPAEVQRGDTISFDIHFIKHEHYEVHSTRSIICDDGNLVTLANPVESTNVPLGEHIGSLELIIPKKVSNGNCHVELTNEYCANPLNCVERVLKSESFFVYE